MYKAKITSKGQITLPAGMRKELGVEPGESVVFFPGDNGEFRVRRVGSIQDLFGIAKKLGYVQDGPALSLEEIKEAIGEHVAELDAATMSPGGRRRTRRNGKKAA
jgi:AbrB family looped-hinge helix DNA binding protein